MIENKRRIIAAVMMVIWLAPIQVTGGWLKP
jgi:hypothetical protein